jgi:hypothetical protein
MTPAADRGRELARQAHNNGIARTRLNMALHHLEIGADAADAAKMYRERAVLRRVMGDLYEVLNTWPAPDRDRAMIFQGDTPDLPLPDTGTDLTVPS